MTINCTPTNIYPGGQSAHRKEIQFRLTSSGTWNNGNDHSYSGVATGGTHSLATNIPVYDNGVRVFGNEPGGSSPTATATSAAAATATATTASVPTNTPVSATATPVPPTATPVPATNTATPTPGTLALCQVTYAVTSQWADGFNADVTIKNNGASAVNSWLLAWTFPGNQQIVNLWNGALTQSGQAVTVANLSHNGQLAANGGVQSFGFQATFSGANGSPTSFRVNGIACNGSASATATPTVPPTATSVSPTQTPTPTATTVVTATPTPTATAGAPAAACQLRYTITNQWPGGFTADVILKNNGTTPINGWRVAWTFGGNQLITNLWNGAKTQNGQSVQVANLGYNNLIGANGGTQGVGFQGTFSGTNAIPTSFTVNGRSCGIMTTAQALQPGERSATVVWGAYLPLLSRAQ